MLSYEEACAQVTAPGTPFEVVDAEVLGVPRRVFANAPASLRDVVLAAAARGEQTFMVYEDERWSFERFGREVAGLAEALVGRYGIRRGDRVAVAMRNYPEWVVTYAATVAIGAISVSFNAWWTDDEMDFALRDSGTSVLIADRERVERSRRSCDELAVPTISVRAPELVAVAPGAPVEAWSDVVDPAAPMPDVVVDA
ncbi:MAG: AMP-binding protein, partial [Actinobacteria bacterium]|nr:AMP-binding protein [Actinomycetota bacterium]